MDAAGAESLRKRLEQQQNWRQAQAVRDGRQPPVDPDLESFEELRDGVRLYSPRYDASAHRVCKRLVDGMWIAEMVEMTPEAVPPFEREMAHVA